MPEGRWLSCHIHRALCYLELSLQDMCEYSRPLHAIKTVYRSQTVEYEQFHVVQCIICWPNEWTNERHVHNEGVSCQIWTQTSHRACSTERVGSGSYHCSSKQTSLLKHHVFKMGLSWSPVVSSLRANCRLGYLAALMLPLVSCNSRWYRWWDCLRSPELMIRKSITLKIPIETHHTHISLLLILAFKVKAFLFTI